MKKNVIVGQSGGPTAVINASLAGVYKTAKDMGADTIYGMRYGIQGLLEKKIVDLGEKIRNDMDVELLKRTPASFLGSAAISCRRAVKIKLSMRKYLQFWKNWRLRHFSISVAMIPWIP